MRTLRTFVWLLLLAGTALAQFTTVTGTVVDPNGLPYAFGTITPLLVIPSGAGSPTLNGSPYSPPTGPTGLGMNGSFTLNLGDNTVLLPANTKWNFTVCSGVGTVQPAIGTGSQCFTLAAPITISGASQSITANLNAVALALTVPGIAGAVVSVGATAPITSSGGVNPNIGCATCLTTSTGILTNPAGSQTIQGPATNSALILLGSPGVSSQQLEIHNAFSAGLNIFTHSNTSFRGPTLTFNRSDGTQAAPTAVTINQQLAYVSFLGYDGTNYSIAAQIVGQADENFVAGTNLGSHIDVFATPTASATPLIAATFTGTKVQVGATLQFVTPRIQITGSGTVPAAGYIALGTTTVGALPAAAAGNVGEIIKVNDSTAIAAEGQTCVGSGAVSALAFSNGTVWKCF